MNRKIQKSLLATGHALAPPADEPPAKPFFAWFEQNVLGLDSEEYRRAFWREACRTDHSIGRTPRTLESWQRERGIHPAARPGEIHSNVKFKMENVKRPSYSTRHFSFYIFHFQFKRAAPPTTRRSARAASRSRANAAGRAAARRRTRVRRWRRSARSTRR